MRYLHAKVSLVGLLLTVCLLGCDERGDTDEPTTTITTETPDHFLEFLNDQRGNTYSAEYTQAYYHAVDPNDERTSLESWKARNGFGSCDDQVHIIFRDAKDLGYGRDMYACKHTSGDSEGDQFDEGRFAVFVQNYIVKVFDSDPSNYGPINVEAAIEANLTYHAGTNAIEFSPLNEDAPIGPNNPRVAKFFTFKPNGAQNFQADLDGRGDKHMPQPCLLCHGATLQPWDSEEVLMSATPWELPEVAQTLRSAKFNQLEVDSFDYSTRYPQWSRTNQEARFLKFNQWVRDTFNDMALRADTRRGYWCPDFANELALGRYGQALAPVDPMAVCGAQTLTDFSGVYDDDFVPQGWQPSASRPEGVDFLYKRVVEPHCISCHSLRGYAAGERSEVEGSVAQPRTGNAINFNSYEEFIGYADMIEDYVYRRGVMPLSLRNYLSFWETPNDAPAILASFLPGFSHYNTNGFVSEPGAPVAMPGAERTVVSPATLDGSASYYAGSYGWQIVDQPVGALAQLSAPQSAVTEFSANLNGRYVLRLSVSNALGTDTAELTVHVDSAMNPAPSQINFFEHIMPILRESPDLGLPQNERSKRENCSNCHSESAGTNALNNHRGIPVYYSYSSVADLNRNLYRDVLARVDLNEPENSLLLRKPTRPQHGGGVVIDLNNPFQYATYETVLHWVRNGAPCDNAAGDGALSGVCPGP
jgi:hypothetical protein